MSHTTGNITPLIRADLWTSEIKEILEDELMGMKYVRMLSSFPDGDTFHIPSIGQAEVDDYVEDQDVKFQALATGDFTFQITEYKSAATYITDKAKQDSFYADQLIASFVPKMTRAIMVEVESDIMSLASQQTAGDLNEINGAAHRFVASGASGEITLQDFAKAKLALKKANAGDRNLVAIVDPSVEYTLSTLTNLVNVSNNPKWEGIVRDGIATGMKFSMNVYGFDVFTSNYVHNSGAETIDGNSTNATGVSNMFFSADASILPFIGAIRQPASVEFNRNVPRQRDEYVVTMRYGFKLYRPENLVVVLTNTDVIA